MGPLGLSLRLLNKDITNFVKTSILPTYSSFLQVSRPWKAARRCTSCPYPNDHDENFCQACGILTGVPVTPVVQPGLDMSVINSRFVKWQALSEAKVFLGATVVKFPRLSFAAEVHALRYLGGYRYISY